MDSRHPDEGPPGPDLGSPPPWLTGIRAALDADPPHWFTQFAPPEQPRRRSAVLVLFAGRTDESGRPNGYSVVLTERAESLRSHAAQVAFPGGMLDDGDDGPIDAAIREAEEEIGLNASTVHIVDELPPLYMYPSENAVTPVLGWWTDPHPVGVVDEAEVARVVLADLDELLDPANRFTVVGFGDYRGPGFAIDGLFVWGFTAVLLDHVLDLAALSTPWDREVERVLPDRLIRTYLTG